MDIGIMNHTRWCIVGIVYQINGLAGSTQRLCGLTWNDSIICFLISKQIYIDQKDRQKSMRHIDNLVIQRNFGKPCHGNQLQMIYGVKY